MKLTVNDRKLLEEIRDAAGRSLWPYDDVWYENQTTKTLDDNTLARVQSYRIYTREVLGLLDAILNKDTAFGKRQLEVIRNAYVHNYEAAKNEGEYF